MLSIKKKKNNTFSFKTQLNYNPKKEKKQGENFISSFHVAKNTTNPVTRHESFSNTLYPLTKEKRKNKTIPGDAIIIYFPPSNYPAAIYNYFLS